MIRFLHLFICIVVMALYSNAETTEIPQDTNGIKWTLICDGKKKGFKTENGILNPQQKFESIDLIITPIGQLFICNQKPVFYVYDWSGNYLCNINIKKATSLTIERQWRKNHKVTGNEKILYLKSRSKGWSKEGVIQVKLNYATNTFSAKEIIPVEYSTIEEYNGWWWCCYASVKGRIISRNGSKILPKDGLIKPYELKTVLGCFKVGHNLYSNRGDYIVGDVSSAIEYNEEDFNYINVSLYGGNRGIVDGKGNVIVPFGSYEYVTYVGNGEFKITEKSKRNSTKTMHYDPWGWYGTQMYNDIWKTPYIWTSETYDYPSNNSIDNSNENLDIRRTEILNNVVGENCLTCHGTGKCPTCNGRKITSSMGNTYKCNVCDDNGNCPTCHGTGKTSWNN